MITYDFTSLNEFFNTIITPSELLEDLDKLVRNYTLCHNECQSFKDDISVIYVLYDEIKKLRQQQTT